MRGNRENIRNGHFVEKSSLFFLTVLLELSTGFFHLPSLLAETVQNESWIVLIATAFLVQLFIFLGLSTMRRMPSNNWYELVDKYLSKVGGSFFALLLSVFFLLMSSFTLSDYIQMLQQFMFPRTSTLVLACLVIVPVLMLLAGGISLISRFAVLVVLIIVAMLFPLFIPMPSIQAVQLLPLPVMHGTVYLHALYHSIQCYLGIVVLFFVYPYISPQSGLIQRISYGHWFASFILIFLNFTITGTTGYEFAQQFFYPSLHAYRVSQFAITERFEFIIITNWSLVVIVMISCYLWLVQLALPHMYLKSKQSFAWILVLLTLCIVMILPSEFTKFQEWLENVKGVGTLSILLAIVCLWLLSKFKKTVRR